MSNLLSPIDIITEAELRYSDCLTREARARFVETKLRRILRPGSSRSDFAYPNPPLICLVSHISRYRSAGSPYKQATVLDLTMVGDLNILPSEYHILSSRSASTGDIPRAAQALKDKRDDLCKAVPSLLHVRDELRKCTGSKQDCIRFGGDWEHRLIQADHLLEQISFCKVTALGRGGYR